MTTFLQVIILVAIASIAILVIYLIDRVNTLQRYTRLLQSDISESEDPNAGPFGGLTGERLWDAVSGVPIDGWDKNSIDLVRNRYQLVLRKHVEELFLEGFQNSQAGIQAIPSSSRFVQTLRGPVESWIPIEHAIAVHQAGFERGKGKEEDLPAVRKSLDEAASILFGLAGIKLPRPLSEHLVPLTEAEQAAAAVASAQANLALPGAPLPAAGVAVPALTASPAAATQPAQVAPAAAEPAAPNIGDAMAAALSAYENAGAKRLRDS
jgi:hypothetical protein